MRAFLEFVLRGPAQAILVAVLFTALPLLFWLGGAVVALITLRHGLSSGLKVFVWAMLPALLLWYWQRDPGPACTLIFSFVMAGVLQRTASWEKTLITGVALGLLLGALVPTLMGQFVADIVKLTEQFYSHFNPDFVKRLGNNFIPYFTSLMIGSIAASYFGFGLLSVMLGRTWQAKLFNPGGFKKEFYEFRLSPGVATVLFLLMLLSTFWLTKLLVVILVVSIPLTTAGLALIHGSIAKRNMGGHWIFAFYVFAVVFGPGLFLLLILLAVGDSWLDLRKHIRPPSKP